MRKVVLFITAAVASALIMGGCGNRGNAEQREKAEMAMEKARQKKDYRKLIGLADSLEKDGGLSTAEAYYWRGYGSDRSGQKRMAEFYYKTAIEAAGDEDMDACAKAASYLANLMSKRGDYEQALKMAEPVARRLEELKCDTTSDYVNLMIYIGCCQAGLGLLGDDTADGFDRAYERHLDNVKKNRTDEAYKEAIAGLINITYACNFAQNYREALEWNSHFGEMINEYEQRLGVNKEYVDKQQARYNLYQAQALEGLGRNDEASKAFENYRTTLFAKTPEGQIMANDYLITAKRWGEAADNYQSLDALMAGEQGGYSLDNIRDMVLRKYEANLKAGRRDTAVAVSMLLCDSLARAFDQARQTEAEEQATIVAEVEAQNEQQAEAVKQGHYRTMGLLALLLSAFIGYIIYRRWHHHQLHQAHQELRKDYDALEARATENSRTETEQQLAADIQQAMTGTQLPEQAGLCVLADCKPGQMAGGSFSDAVVKGDKLTFCIGSATGKGIRATAAAAMAWAQFRTAAALGHTPEEIVGSISEVIADGKQMPVRMFAGEMDLSNGKLRYCNAGNGTPLLADEELGMLPGEEGVPAGSEAGVVYTASEATLGKGKLLFLYTEGVTEATDSNGRKLGEKQLRGMALQTFKTDRLAKHFFENMKKAVREFGEGTQEEDERMMVVGR